MYPTSDGGSQIGGEYFTTYKGSIVKAMGQWGIRTKPLVTANTLGKWIKFKFHRKVASSANNDSVMQIWVNDVLVIDEQKLEGYPGNGYQNAYTAGYLLGWANSGFDKETYIYIDDVTVSTSNALAAEPTIAPPMPPSTIK